MSVVVFWASLIVVGYTYAGYALIVAVLARARGSEPLAGAITPAVTVIIAAYNEARTIAARVRNVLQQDYPAERLSVIVVSDGSRDGTAQAAAVDDRVQVLALAENRGKACALNAAMALVRTQFVVFADARQRFAPDALRRLLAAFADPAVGAVTGELRIEADCGGQPSLYWRMETRLRADEARLGWLHGVSGAIAAMRTALFQPMPERLLLDDVWIPLHVAFAGRRVWMARDAIARDVSSATAGEEYRRKLRTLAGNWQLIASLPRVLNPIGNPLFFAWLSHKLLRLLAPWALIAAFVASALAEGGFYRVALIAQMLAYVAATTALLAPRSCARVPLLAAAGSFVMLNCAALMALPAWFALGSRRLWSRR
jgi:biofilm PGA synthesis N-glycosyltransferase PgaC